MKTQIMKHILNVLLVTLFAAALMLSYRAHMELKTNYEALAWQMKNKTDQFDAIIAANFQRTHQDAQKIAELKAQIKALTAGADQLTSSR
jgi:hypothetical protein